MRKTNQLNYCTVVVLFVIMAGTALAQKPKGCFPGDKLPPYITLLTEFGERSEWSHDGKTVYFVDCFQAANASAEAGVGCGFYLIDVGRWKQSLQVNH